jgi:hypothetical protein
VDRKLLALLLHTRSMAHFTRADEEDVVAAINSIISELE